MDQDLQNAFIALGRTQDQFEAVIMELYRMFPHDSNPLAWRDKIFTEQRKWQSGPNDPNDYQMQIALHFLDLAREERLQVALDDRGFSVIELDDKPMKHAELKAVIFKEISQLTGSWLLYPSLFAAVDRYLGLSLSQNLNVLKAVLGELSDKNYIRFDQSRARMLRITRGLNFDEWKNTMTKPRAPSVTHNAFTFNGQIGAVQTGEGSVANVQQTSGANPFADLKAALQTLLQELPKSDLPVSERQDAEELIGKTIQEINSEKPSKGVVKALCSGLATTVQTLGSASAAYALVSAAFTHYGISLG